MNPENIKALMVAYYLSRYDQIAYQHLGYATNTATHEAIGERLVVNPNTVKNMRDEFDSIHENSRVGWYQRPLRPSRQKIVEAFQELTEPELYEIVTEILSGSVLGDEDLTDLVLLVAKREETPQRLQEEPVPYIVRGPTGRKAEEHFISYHQNIRLPFDGELTDMRDLGCGYDFKINSGDEIRYVEVKGMAVPTFGILFTSKEWETAMKYGKDYILAIVRNVNDDPEFQFISDPAHKLEAEKSIHTTLQIRWTVSGSKLSQHIPDEANKDTEH